MLKRAFAFACSVVLAACGLSVVGSDPTNQVVTLPDGAVVVVSPDGAILPVDSGGTVTPKPDGAQPNDSGQPDTGPVHPDCLTLTRGPKMVKLSAYCIDSTEVSQVQYAAFLAEVGNGPYKDQHAGCQGVQGHKPGTGGSCQYSATSNKPIACVDWCDAESFCRWSGKRLCGKIGGGPILKKVANTDYRSATLDQWFAACTGGGTTAYPYGNSQQVDSCNTFDSNFPSGAHDVGIVSCVGGFPGIFDMSGNVREFEDACDSDDANANCLLRGGAFSLATQNATCDDFFFVQRDQYDDDIGFRCCADL